MNGRISKRMAGILLLVAMTMVCQGKVNNDFLSNRAKVENAAKRKTAKWRTIPFTLADHYFVRNDVSAYGNKVITTKKQFFEFFGMGAVMGKNGLPTAIDFSKQYVIAVIKPETFNSAELKAVTLRRDQRGNIVFTYRYKVGEKQTYSIVPCLIVIVDKTASGKVTFVSM
jgi:hypothetical protein